MPGKIGQRELLCSKKLARAHAELDKAANASLNTISVPHAPAKNKLNGKSIVIIGAGVAGLTTAYEILSSNDHVNVTILEAHNRTGGRCLSLRDGDTLVEDKTSDLYSEPGDQQVVHFDWPHGDQEPFLNAGPGRIPSSHKRLLDYLKRFNVPIEVYVMNSSSNLTQMEKGPDGTSKPVVNRRLLHNSRGWIAQMIYKNAPHLLGKPESDSKVELLRSFMITFGDLDPEGNYVVAASDPGEDDTEAASDRAGFTDLPGVTPGTVVPAFSLDQLLDSKFWDNTRIYQHQDFLWQPTLLHPVHGMDQVQKAFRDKVISLGGTIHLESPVSNISYDPEVKKYLISAEGWLEPFAADYCFCNAAIPFLERMLSTDLQNSTTGFEEDFLDALQAVYKAQANEHETERFLAYTTKVGWQADRSLWQGKPFVRQPLNKEEVTIPTPPSDVGVVPIYGGISWTQHPITQIWYPSTSYYDRLGILTGCYNFAENALNYGNMSPADRLLDAKKGAAVFGQEFADGLNMDTGVAIAWQKIPNIKGGWSQWHTVTDSVKHFNAVIQGTTVAGSDMPTFFVVGDQVSSLPGWQEGAIASALQALTRIAEPKKKLPYLKNLPDTRLMVEGV